MYKSMQTLTIIYIIIIRHMNTNGHENPNSNSIETKR